MRKLFVFLLSLLIAVIAFPFCILIGPREAREFFYTDLSYSMVVNRIAERTCEDEEVVLKIFDYVHENVFSLSKMVPKKEKYSYDNLISSIGWCDQQSNIFITLLETRGIPGRLVVLQVANGSSHTVAEVLIDRKWRIFDVTYGYIFRTKEREMATLDDIQKQGINLSCNQFKLATSSRFEQEEYLRFYATSLPPRIIKDNSKEFKQEKIMEFLGRKSKKNKIISESALVISGLLGGYYKILGKPFYNLFQDLYLLSINFSDADFNLFYKARALHLASRYETARKYYNFLIKRFPRSSYVDDCYFFIAKSFMDGGDNGKALYNFRSILKIYSPSLKSEEAIAELERVIDMSFDFNKTPTRIEKTLDVLEKNKIPSSSYYRDFDDIEKSIPLYMLGTSKNDLFEKEDIVMIYLRHELKKLLESYMQKIIDSEQNESSHNWYLGEISIANSVLSRNQPSLEFTDLLVNNTLKDKQIAGLREDFENYLNKIINSSGKDARGKFNADEVKTIFKYYLLRGIIKDRFVGLILCWLSDFENVSEYWREEDIFLRLMDACLEPDIATIVRLEDKLNYPFNKNSWEQVVFYYVGICLLREHNYNEAKAYLERVKNNNQTYAALLLENLN